MLSPDRDEIRRTVRRLILREFLPGEDEAELESSAPLITGGILDSVDTIRLVSIIESSFSVTFGSGEVNLQNLNTIDQIVSIIKEKLEESK